MYFAVGDACEKYPIMFGSQVDLDFTFSLYFDIPEDFIMIIDVRFTIVNNRDP